MYFFTLRFSFIVLIGAALSAICVAQGYLTVFSGCAPAGVTTPSHAMQPATTAPVDHVPVRTTRYTISALKTIKAGLPPLSLPPALLQKCRDLGIAPSRTTRGTRGGRRRQRNIPVVRTVRSDRGLHRGNQRGVNHSVLTVVNCKPFYQELPKQFKVLYQNVRSCRNKTDELADHIHDSNADLVFFTETWLNPVGDEAVQQQLVPPGYCFYSMPRLTRSGGGIGVIYRNTIQQNVKLSKQKFNFNSFELCVIHVQFSSQSVSFACIYRPPPSKKNKSTTSQFIAEFSDLLVDFTSKYHKLIILGDFNLWFDNVFDVSVRSLKTSFENYHLSQLVDKPTHHHGHILDWVIASDKIDVSEVCVEDKLVSDHYNITFNLDIKQPEGRIKRTVTSRNLKRLDMAAFQEDVKVLDLNDGDRVASLNTGLRTILDKHAPLTTRSVTSRSSAPWLTLEVKQAKTERRRAERKWRKSGLTIHKQIFLYHINKVKHLIAGEKRAFLCAKVENSTSSKELFHLTNQMLGKTKETPLPDNIPLGQLPASFCAFFTEKIAKLRQELDSVHSCPEFSQLSASDAPLSEFSPVTEEQVRKIISQSAKKSCSLDPIPSSLLYECLDSLISKITCIINDSLLSGTVSPSFKHAVVKPLLKKPSLDKNDLKNYRPVSNLPFLSKVLEKVVLVQLARHLERSDLIEPFQSAYRANHSTETALLRVTNSLLTACDTGQASLLSLLDLSAAFDTLDHNILLDRLHVTFGISGTALHWFKSYLVSRTQSVEVGGVTSVPSLLKYGVPQGSVLGPVLFTLYMEPLGRVISHHGMLYQLFADDTQLQKTARPAQFPEVVSTTQNCIESVNDWMTANKLKMNNDKTEIMPVATQHKLKQISVTSSLTVFDTVLSFSTKVKDLGVFLDSSLSMDSQISNICRTASFELRRLSQIRPYLTLEAAKRLACASILSRLDYCNSLLMGIDEFLLDRLQRIQNHAARIVLRKRKRDHAKPLLQSLHWLPVRARIQYKLATLCFRVKEGTAPSYLTSLLTPYCPPRSLRSSDACLFVVPRFHLERHGKRSFSVAGPTLWNSLPKHLHDSPSLSSFKSGLKTFLFQTHLN